MASAKQRSIAGEVHRGEAVVQRHFKVGWYSLLCFLTLGLCLEAMHGIKMPFYLSVSHETRRLMWTLAHAHGTLLGLINLGMAVSVHYLPDWPFAKRQLASYCLMGGTILVPAGFFLGGLFLKMGDPGLPVMLVPVGGILLLMAVFHLARASAGTVSHL